jgi:hypothetical protein
MANNTPDNVIPFPAEPTPPDVGRIIDVAPDIRKKGALTTSWNLVRQNTFDHGDEVLLLSLAIGCLCVEIARLKGEKLGV